MYSLGYEIGSSSIKVAIIELSTKKEVAISSYLENEITVEAPKIGWAEQNPDLWWKNVCIVTKQLF